HCCKFVIWQIMLPGSLLNNFGNFSIMNMAYVRENMMFDLVIKPSGKPIYNFVLWSKVSGSVQLVYSPCVFYLIYIVGQGIGRFLNNMSKLKNNAKYKACSIVHNKKAQ